MDEASSILSRSTSESSEWVAVGTEAELKEKRRKTLEVSNRKVTIFFQDVRFYVLDFHCYHAGGPLDVGNIEEVNGVSCVVCPWHKYKISLGSGEGFYQSIDPHDRKKPPCWKSKGVKQRTHHIEVRGQTVYVKLSTSKTELESDHYYSKKYREMMDPS
ncbi:Rieske domain-containing protein-like [Asterias amurensis]|uniref:Rieske domain-containing protein-like n=1 Tax=Asterias amurensis TaxID=7602 RepID=UPI003AB1C44B